jgi:hypothetical protein
MVFVDIAFQRQDPLGGFRQRVDAGRARRGGVAGTAVEDDLQLEETALGVAHLEVALLADQAIVGFDEASRGDLVHEKDGALRAAGFLIGDDMRL